MSSRSHTMPTTRISSDTRVSGTPLRVDGLVAAAMVIMPTSSAPPSGASASEHGDDLAVLLSDLAPGEVQEHVVEGRAMGPHGAHRHTGGRNDGADGSFFVGDEGGQTV